MEKKIVFLLLCGTLIQATSVDQCIDRIIDFSLLDYRARRFGIDRIGTPLDEEIRFLSDIQFNCSTIINSVILGIEVRPNRDSFPSVQIWRKTAGSNYVFVPGSERCIFYTTENVSRTGVYDYPLEPPLEVERGDLLAFSQPSQSKSSVRGYYIDLVTFDSRRIKFGETKTHLPNFPTNNILVLVYPVTDKQCVNSINATFIKDKSLLISESRSRDRRQLLYPELKFSCNGSVIKWIYGAVDRRATGELPEIQIWRQTDTDTYTKQTFSHVSANETEPGTNIHEYYPETPLEFQEGDILGYFQPDEHDSQIVLYAQRESGPTNLHVDGNVDIAPIAVTISELLEEEENNYPLISLEISISTKPVITSSISSTTISTGVSTESIIAITITVTSSSTLSTDVANKISSTVTSPPSLDVRSSTITISLSTVTSHPSLDVWSSTISTSLSTVTSPSSLDVRSSTISTSLSTVTSPSSLGVWSSTISTSLSTVTSPSSLGVRSSTISTFLSTVTSPPSLDVRSSTISMSLSTFVTPTVFPSNNNKSNFIGPVVAVFILLVITIVCTIVVGIILWKKRTDKSPELEESNNLPYSEKKNTSMIGKHMTTKPIIKHLLNENSNIEDASVIPCKTELTCKPPCEYELPIPYHTSQSDAGGNIGSVNSLTYTHLEWNVIVPTLAQREIINNQFSDVNSLRDSLYTPLSVNENLCAFLNYNQELLFAETEVYWTPGSDCGSLYEQLALRKYREILRAQINITGHLGSGEFGTVAKGIWQSPTGPMNVAVKTLKEQASEEDKVKFLQEAAINGQFHHPNIIQLFGVVTVGEPIMIVLEMMNNGDMRKYLQTLKPFPGELVASNVPYLLLSFCRQIASGMDYLSKKHFIHRDLAAYWLLMELLAKDLDKELCYVSKGGQIPIKWTAPEAISSKTFSTASDVWSFGVLMFEIWSLGEKPFQRKTNQETFQMICDGYRLPPPPGCSRTIYEMMIQCWHPETSERPSFVILVSKLSQPDYKVLYFLASDKGIHRQASVLGAPLEAGQNLYLDLQNMYDSYPINL